MTAPTGHIRNPRATRGGAPAQWAPGTIRREITDFADLDAILRDLAAAGVRRLVIEGGDGTVREVLSRAPEIWAGAPPDYAIVKAGNTNLIARQVGAVTPAALDPGRLRRRETPLLTVIRAGARPLRGFILGAGAYEKATTLAQREIALRHGPQVALAVLRALMRPEIRAANRIGFAPGAAPGAAAPPEDRLLIAVTSLQGPLIYGLDPFRSGAPATDPATDEATNAGALRWLDIRAGAPRLALGVFFTACGRPRRWMATHYHRGRADQAAITLDGPFVMDGEAFEPGADGGAHVSTRESATFLSA